MLSDALEFMFGFGDIIWGKNKISEPEQAPEDKEEKNNFYLSEVNPKKYSFRPQNLDEYVGQENAKSLVRLNLQKIIQIKPVHIIISGSAGYGKTTLANIISNHLAFDITYHIGGTFSLEALRDFLLKNEENKKPNILFIDEIHNLEKIIAEFMYPIVEDFILPKENVRIKPFILIGATTEKSTLIKKFKPLVDRCGCQIELSDYTAEDMKKIIGQYYLQVYSEKIDEQVLDLLAINCRFTPRIALALADDYKVCGNISQVLNAHRIVKNSLTYPDIKILEHLAEIDKPVAQETLAVIGSVDKSDYRLLVEPYLLRQGYLARTSRGRLITNKGKLLLQEVKNGK